MRVGTCMKDLRQIIWDLGANGLWIGYQWTRELLSSLFNVNVIYVGMKCHEVCSINSWQNIYGRWTHNYSKTVNIGPSSMDIWVFTVLFFQLSCLKALKTNISKQKVLALLPYCMTLSKMLHHTIPVSSNVQGLLWRLNVLICTYTNTLKSHWKFWVSSGESL